MRLLIIYQYFLSDDEPGHTRWNEMTKLWSDLDCQITVVCGMVNYSTGKKNKRFKNKFFVKEKYYNNVDVLRCHVSNSYNKNFIGRLWAYFSFIIFGIFGFFYKTNKAYDAVLVSSPPLFVGIIGLILSKVKKIPLIFEIRDLWPESAIETGVVNNKNIINLAYWLEKTIYNNSILLNVLTPAFKEYLINKKNISENNIIYIPNAANFDMMQQYSDFDMKEFREKIGWTNKFIIIYVGAHGVANHLQQLIDAANLLKNTNAHIVLIGDGMKKNDLINYSNELNLDNVEFINPVSKQEIMKYILSSDVGTSVLQKNDVFKTVYSNKTFDYMVCKKPILIGIDGVSKRLIESANAGFYVNPEDPVDFARNAKKLIENKDLCIKLGINGYNYAKSFFDREKLSREYLNLISSKLSA